MASEHALNLHTKNTLMLPPDQLARDDAEMPPNAARMLEDMHIYAIARRQGFEFKPNSVSLFGGVLKGDLIVYDKGNATTVPFEFPTPFPSGWRAEVGPYPHKDVFIRDPSGEKQGSIPAFMATILSGLSLNPEYSYEVLYIGQAFGQAGERSALDRLRKHETLQKILARAHGTDPRCELMIFTFEYVAPAVMTNIAPVALSEEDEAADTARWVRMMDKPPSIAEQISIAESALINYSQPEFNKTFKNLYPREDLETLKSCYDLDFNGLTVEINVGDLKARIHSSTRKPGMHHIAAFDLHDEDKRKSFFSFSDAHDSGIKLSMSGPVY